MNLTPGRRAWLERLAREGVAKRTRGRVGFDCMRAGLTQWAYRDRVSGDFVAEDALLAKYCAGGVPWDCYEMVGEKLTYAGRKVVQPSLLRQLFPHS